MYQDNPHVVAVATDVPMELPLPRLDLNDVEAIAGFILRHQGFR
jgi:molybdopterin-guanine dinucleotide biosynthesis protein B